MGKHYIPVNLYIDAEGKVTPLEIQAGYDEEWIKIIKVTETRRMASLIAGGLGVRYTCIIHYYDVNRTIYLFDEKGRWFVESDD